MRGSAVCALFVLVSLAFLEADAKKHFRRLESKTLDRKRRSMILKDAEKEEIVKVHNDLRRLEGSSNMRFMHWNDVLATMAEAWVETCTYGHNESFLKPPPSFEYGSVGQNFMQITVSSINMTWVTLEWYKEKSSYNYDTGKCSSRSCGHYKQVVWASSHLIGCAYRHCAKIAGSNTRNSIVFVCNYAPPGNWPGRPFKKGRPCSECAKTDNKCNKGLCDRK